MQRPTTGKNMSAQAIPLASQETLGVGIPEKVEIAIMRPCSIGILILNSSFLDPATFGLRPNAQDDREGSAQPNAQDDREGSARPNAQDDREGSAQPNAQDDREGSA